MTGVKRRVAAPRMLVPWPGLATRAFAAATDEFDPPRRAPTMPWNETYYPASMRHLSPPVRAKAIEIANALLEEGMDEGKAIRIAIAKAKAWAAQRGLPVRA
ncbi:MAG: hypothetical protein N3D71_13180 [Burkholderiaceae bacterium]|nr:hypothetical protein [Burkholderiaceae bacterium]